SPQGTLPSAAIATSRRKDLRASAPPIQGMASARSMPRKNPALPPPLALTDTVLAPICLLMSHVSRSSQPQQRARGDRNENLGVGYKRRKLPFGLGSPAIAVASRKPPLFAFSGTRDAQRTVSKQNRTGDADIFSPTVGCV